MRTNHKVILIFALGVLILACGRKERKAEEKQHIPFRDSEWTVYDYKDSLISINVVTEEGKEVLRLEPGQRALVKDGYFRNFQVEFWTKGLTPGVGFRVQDAKNFDYLYLRVAKGGYLDALQYVPIHNGNLPWQLYNYPKYEGRASFPVRQEVFLPMSFKTEIVIGKASENLLRALNEEGKVFSETSVIDYMEEDLAYIYDPENSNVLGIRFTKEGISFLEFKQWVRVKMVVVQDQMDVYIGDMDKPAFTVDHLKRDDSGGGFSLISSFDPVFFSDFSINEIRDAGKPRNPKGKESPHMKEFLKAWQISEPFVKDSTNFKAQVDSVLEYKKTFKTVLADEDGLINVSKYFNDMTKTVVLTCNLVSNRDRTVPMNFDYADHLVIMLDSQILFDGGMDFRPPPGKGVEGRVIVTDESVPLELKKGSNELVFMLSGDARQKFNWGFLAKLTSMEGISIN
ncbi:hypothetical protein [Algoriphagus sp.]|uniref:hypothetical protein n=1 Tax=Algoriphagus sp. TaxID=1872435 RepID=UPI002629F79D|nr:hypothetical protein [Algoriphagus sp.]